jgi:hypothetical protein
MAQVLCETHFWTLKQPLLIDHKDLSCFGYHDKKERRKFSQMLQLFCKSLSSATT